MPDYPIEELLTLCERAGSAICQHYHAADAEEFISKSDDSPLTRADLASHAVSYPTYNFASHHTTSHGASHPSLWLPRLLLQPWQLRFLGLKPRATICAKPQRIAWLLRTVKPVRGPRLLRVRGWCRCRTLCRRRTR